MHKTSKQSEKQGTICLRPILFVLFSPIKKMRLHCTLLISLICMLYPGLVCGDYLQFYTETAGVSFAVIADPHFYDPELGTQGPYFEQAMSSEIKLFRYSQELLQAALKEIELAEVDFLIIPGDLTKDGELSSHKKLASHLLELKEKGIPAFVVPGNHDINNPEAVQYLEIEPGPTAGISAQEFARIYAEFGYKDPIFRDPYSLSYVAEPIPGLWLLAMDSCIYPRNAVKSVTKGAFKQKTLEWIVQVLDKAKNQNKKVIGFMHHAVLENFSGHAELLPGFIIDDHEQVCLAFALSGLQVVFTGHTHVQDATVRHWTGGYSVYDIQTGSLITYPHPYRIIYMHHGLLGIHSRFIQDIPGDFGQSGFYEYSRLFMELSAKGLAEGYGLNEPWSELFVRAYIGHALGDEQPGAIDKLAISWLQASPLPLFNLAGDCLQAVWTDLEPQDNNLVIQIR